MLWKDYIWLYFFFEWSKSCFLFQVLLIYCYILSLFWNLYYCSKTVMKRGCLLIYQLQKRFFYKIHLKTKVENLRIRVEKMNTYMCIIDGDYNTNPLIKLTTYLNHKLLPSNQSYFIPGRIKNDSHTWLQNLNLHLLSTWKCSHVPFRTNMINRRSQSA